jgi:hypothetical protein
VLARRDFGVSSVLFKVSVASIIDFDIQGILGLFSIGSDVAVVIHLTNAFPARRDRHLSEDAD